jgi:hypothetical protein
VGERGLQTGHGYGWNDPGVAPKSVFFLYFPCLFSLVLTHVLWIEMVRMFITGVWIIRVTSEW